MKSNLWLIMAKNWLVTLPRRLNARMVCTFDLLSLKYYSLFMIAGLIIGFQQNASCQISRGSAEGEIFIQCPIGYIDRGLFHSTDNGAHLSLLYRYPLGQYGLIGYADSFPGVFYNIRDTLFDLTEDYGDTWTTLTKPKGEVVVTGCQPGELYVTSSNIYFPDLFRSSDFGLSWNLCSSGFSLINYLADVGTNPGELYAVNLSGTSDTIELKYSSDYGISFASIFVDTSLVYDSLQSGLWLTHGTSQGEFYLIRKGSYPYETSFYIYRTVDNGITFSYQGSLPFCTECTAFSRQGISFTAGRDPGSFYCLQAQPYLSGSSIISKICIYYSNDFAQTFTSNCYLVDTLFTNTVNHAKPCHDYQLSCDPNPIELGTEISFSLSKSGEVELTALNTQGVVEHTLVHSTRSVGNYIEKWDGCDGYGNLLPPGVYILALKIDGVPVATEKVVILKQ